MASGQAIDTRLEKLLPASNEWFTAGLYTKDEIQNIMRQRTSFEYRLAARPLLKVDVDLAIDYELNIESQIEEDSKDGIFLKRCITIQRRYRGWRSRKFVDMKKIRNTRAQVLKREIIDALNECETHAAKIELVQKRLVKEKQESDVLVSKMKELTDMRDGDKEIMVDLQEQLRKVKQEHEAINKEVET